MPDNKYFLIMNPTARSGKGREQCEEIISLLKNKNVEFSSLWTTKPGDAINLAAIAAQQNYQTVVAVGGDGTICEGINCLFNNY